MGVRLKEVSEPLRVYDRHVMAPGKELGYQHGTLVAAAAGHEYLHRKSRSQLWVRSRVDLSLARGAVNLRPNSRMPNARHA